MLTAVYSFRLIYLVFLNKNNAYKRVLKNIHELPIEMGTSLAILSLGSIFTGYLSRDLFIGLGSNFFDDSVFILPQNMILVDAEFIPHYIKILPTVLALFGIGSSLFFHKYYEYYFVFFRYQKQTHSIYKFLVQKWYFDFIQNKYVGEPLLYIAYNIFFKVIDKGFLEILGPTGISYVFYKYTTYFRKLQIGYIYQYSFILVFFFFIILTFLELV
jgi:NADH-ubiquinone oxidoreductase chain 5